MLEVGLCHIIITTMPSLSGSNVDVTFSYKDLPAQPSLVTIDHGGSRKKVIIQVWVNFSYFTRVILR